MTFGLPSRRGILIAGAGLIGIGAAGCYTVSPIIDPGTRESPTITITPRRRAALNAESELAATAKRAAAAATGSVAALLAAVARIHTLHAGVLAQADPLGGQNADSEPVITPSPSPSSASPPSLAQLLTDEKAAAGQYLADAGAAETPGEALLWASLSVFASGVSGQGAPPTQGDAHPMTLPVETLTDARQVLLSRLNALVAGLEWGVGRLPSSDPLHATGAARLDAVEIQRARLRQDLRQASASPTPALPGYQMPATPSTPASTRELWVSLELGVLAGHGRVVAATPGPARSTAIPAMADQAAQLRAYGSGLPAWPGWV
ncbi:DUF4439 domain-containing protein [Acidipropionibacterium acidipropionici]|uniref:DUF4439 domain-containing protein n=1 Tax=Acidipropionibacterium acidipropionici TaxID=1748 RepID=UPI0004287C4F|nr:DUF4439 domain-containing protein [Acidipropionibacterium acidipropionici]ALN15696.1 hypothetical protein ASQ49_10950 [Acidipropionibacterium acidipropionici]APZ08559.1 hypothetical protein BWX38_03960 [Acidipropionibacterium acidipropionici]